jgi:DNA-binding SARP family transcriptional activator
VTRRISLLGRPSVEVDGRPGGSCGRKGWGVLAYLALADRPPTRRRLAELLFGEADDPLRALRWNLTQLRRVLEAPEAIGGDPVALQLGHDDVLDVQLVLSRRRPDHEWLGGLGGELLEGMSFDAAPRFAEWLDLERHHVRGATEALLVELAVARGAAGDHRAAADLALRLVALSEYDAGHHALLVRALIAAGDETAARAHVQRCTARFRDELGSPLPGEIERALRPPATRALSRPAEVEAALGAGRAAIAAGAVPYGIERLREAVALTAGTRDAARAEALLRLAAAQAHSTGDRSATCAARLQEASIIAEECGDGRIAAEAARELGFLHVQVGRRARAEPWLQRAEELTADPVERSRILGVRGMSRSDDGRRDEAVEILERSVALARDSGARRSEAWSWAMIGRVALLVGELDDAEHALRGTADLIATERWTAFAPCVQALLAEVELRSGEVERAGDRLERSYAAARTLGDHCWISMNARGLALARVAAGDLPDALEWIRDALRPEPWYLWVRGQCLRTAVEIAGAAEADEAPIWERELALLTAGAELRELA